MNHRFSVEFSAHGLTVELDAGGEAIACPGCSGRGEVPDVAVERGQYEEFWRECRECHGAGWGAHEVAQLAWAVAVAQVEGLPPEVPAEYRVEALPHGWGHGAQVWAALSPGELNSALERAEMALSDALAQDRHARGECQMGVDPR